MSLTRPSVSPASTTQHLVLQLVPRAHSHSAFFSFAAQAVDVVEEQLARLQGERVAAVLLVGGFSGSEYLYTEIKRRLGDRIPTILQPNDSDIATVQGGARYGLELLRGALSVTNVICPRSYFLGQQPVSSRFCFTSTRTRSTPCRPLFAPC